MRAKGAVTAAPDAARVTTGDKSRLAGIKAAGAAANALGPFDVEIHNTGV